MTLMCNGIVVGGLGVLPWIFFLNSSWLYVSFSAFWHAKSGLEMFVFLGHSVSLMLHEL